MGDYALGLRSKGTSPRNSAIEILRIVCMFFIIMHHATVHSGSYAAPASDYHLLINCFLLPGGKIGFDVFLAISTWFLCTRPFKSERFFRLWFEAIFYSIVFALVAYAVGVSFNGKLFVEAFFVIIGNSHGFIATYLIFYLLTPFLAIILRHVNKWPLFALTTILFFAQVVTQRFGAVFGYAQPFASEITLFVFFYFASATLQRFNPRFIHKPVLLFFIGVALFGYMVAMAWFSHQPQNKFFGLLYGLTIGDESAILNIICGYCFFFAVKDMKIRHLPAVNVVSSTTLGVLAIHDHNILRSAFWTKLFNVTLCFQETPILYFLDLVGFSFLVFAVTASIDLLRQRFLEKPLFGIASFRAFFKKVDCVFAMNNKECVDCPLTAPPAVSGYPHRITVNIGRKQGYYAFLKGETNSFAGDEVRIRIVPEKGYLFQGIDGGSDIAQIKNTIQFTMPDHSVEINPRIEPEPDATAIPNDDRSSKGEKHD